MVWPFNPTNPSYFMPRSSSFLSSAAKNFFSFITVRHPFERLLSAYRDRFFAMDDSEYEQNKAALFRRRYGLKIIQEHRYDKIIFAQQRCQVFKPKRTRPQPNNSTYTTAPTFPEFISYLLATDVTKYNSHWLPVHLLCRPCSLQYTLIAKTETIKRDSRSS